MRYYSSILLCTVAFLVDFALASSSVHTTPYISTANDIKSRSLRSYTSVPGDAGINSEERVGFDSISSRVESLAAKFFKGSSSTEKAALTKLLNSNVHPTELFGTLRLGTGVTKLDDNPQLLQWFRLATAYRKKNGDQALPDLEIYFMLLRQHSTDDVTALIQSLKNAPGLKRLGTSMENSLSGSWINKDLKLETSPETLFDTLRLKEAGTKLDKTPVFHQWLKYVDSYRTKKGENWFSDMDMLTLFQKTIPEENVVTLLQLLRQTPSMTNHAGTMQRFLFEQSKSSHQLMLNAWIKAGERPEQVYKILLLRKINMDGSKNNAMVIQWLRYVKLFRDKTPNHAFSDAQMVKFMQKERPLQSEWELAAFFQMLKETPEVKMQAEHLQTYLFRQWLANDLKPKRVAEMLATPYPVDVVLLPKNDPRYLALETFTVCFAKNKGGEEMLKIVKAAFANENPRGALAVTST